MGIALIVIGYLASCVAAWFGLVRMFLRDYDEVTLGNALFFALLSMFGPFGLAAVLIVEIVLAFARWEGPVIMQRKDKRGPNS